MDEETRSRVEGARQEGKRLAESRVRRPKKTLAAGTPLASGADRASQSDRPGFAPHDEPAVGRFRVQAYSAQIAVDADSHVIVAATVTQQEHDRQQLVPMAEAGPEPKIITADAGC